MELHGTDAVIPRILCVSQRGLHPVVSRCLRFEFEDVVSTIDAVDLVAPGRPPITSAVARRLAARLERHIPAIGWATQVAAPRRRYKMVLVCLQTLGDLYSLTPVSAWRGAGEKSVCYIEDVFLSELRHHRGALDLLRRFDLIFLGCHGSLGAVAEATGRPCRYLPPSVDAALFCPYPVPPQRVIDFYAMGRRSEATHQALLRMAGRGEWFYLFDTHGNTEVSDHREHRLRLAQLIKRTRYFLANAAQRSAPGEPRQEELGFRFFEGAAAGAVLIGDPPRNPVLTDVFGWPDSVVPLPLDSPDIADVIEELEADPERVERIRAANIAQSLRRHDHLHRWEEILRVADLDPLPALEGRRKRLAELAALAEWQDAGTPPPAGPGGSPGSGTAGLPAARLAH